MMKIFNFLGLMALVAALGGCYVVPMENGSRVVQTNSAATQSQAMNARSETMLSARLYPANEIAQHVGAGQATVNITETGHGSFKANIGGEVFSGDATRQLNSRSGKANGVSSGNRYLSCDYTMNSASIGTGTCRLNNGAMYSMHISN